MPVTLIPVQCHGCGQMTQVEAPPPPKVANMDVCSILVVEHPKSFVCEHCKHILVLALAPANVGLYGRPVEQKKESSIILM